MEHGGSHSRSTLNATPSSSYAGTRKAFRPPDSTDALSGPPMVGSTNGWRCWSSPMPKYKMSDFRPAREWLDKLPEERRRKIEAGAAEIIRGIRLAELRKSL